MNRHHYAIEVTWTGNQGQGTKTYSGYTRDHTVAAKGKPVVMGSSDPAFRGDACRYNPEDLLVASLSACHMLWFLHLCAVNKIVVSAYQDEATGVMIERPDGSGAFEEVTLNPRATINAEADERVAFRLHEEAHHMCFIANSVNFPVRTVATFEKKLVNE